MNHNKIMLSHDEVLNVACLRWSVNLLISLRDKIRESDQKLAYVREFVEIFQKRFITLTLPRNTFGCVKDNNLDNRAEEC